MQKSERAAQLTAAGPGLDQRLDAWRDRAERELDAWLPADSLVPQRLHAAQRYSVLGAGKRIRPALVYATAETLGVPLGHVDAAACAVEMIHAYSLVHDDLPAMDDDALRRGRPTVHVAYDEATAILAGDALQSRAFEVLVDAPAAPDRIVAAVRELARAAGSMGMCGGQAIDMAMTGRTQSLDALAAMHRMKTGALIEAAVVMGGLLRGASDGEEAALRRIGGLIGLGFQIKDDLLDAEADSATLGKTSGKDAVQGKSTYATLLGLEGARARLDAVAAELKVALDSFASSRAAQGLDNNGQALADLAVMAVRRSR